MTSIFVDWSEGRSWKKNRQYRLLLPGRVPPPNPQAIQSPIPFFLLDLLPGLASLPPVQYASSFRVQRPKLVSSCLAVKSEQSNFSALHTNHEGSLLHSREHLSCAFIPYQNWMTQNMVLNFVKAPLRVIEGQFLAPPYQ